MRIVADTVQTLALGNNIDSRAGRPGLWRGIAGSRSPLSKGVPKVGWKLSSANIIVASVRYRALLPAVVLERSVCKNFIFTNSSFSNLSGLNCLVFVKAFKPEDYLLALEAHRQRIPVVLDICDNIFIEDYGKKYPEMESRSPAPVFLQMSEIASVIVTSTDPLASVVRQHAPARCPVVVIPDGIETEEVLMRMQEILSAIHKREISTPLQQLKLQLSRLRQRWSLLRTGELGELAPFILGRCLKYVRTTIQRTFLAALSRCKRFLIAAGKPSPNDLPNVAAVPEKVRSVLWFGHHGASYAKFGMLDLLEIRADLETVAKEFPIELVVVSNHKGKFEEFIRPFSLPTRYVEWSNEALSHEIRSAAVVVIPNSLDDFSICKSPNRAVLALKEGVPVVATRTPALSELSTCLFLDDFRNGLRAYLHDEKRRESDLCAAKVLIESLYGNARIREGWSNVLELIRGSVLQSSEGPELLVVVQNQLDWQVVRPVVTEAKRRGVSVGAVLNARQPHDMAALAAHLNRIGVETFPVDPERPSSFVLPDTAKVMLCAAESNLLPHRLAHTLVQKANHKGLFTATIQHGFEMPGLTYHDRLQSVRKIKFSARRIYLWGSIEELHPLVPAETRQKCMTVGLPATITHRCSAPTIQRGTELLTVGIFENLHWLRYSAQYQRFFLDGVHSLLASYPNVQYILRTHPQGRWLEREDAKPLLQLPNVKVLSTNELEEDSLLSVLASIDAVITTPSTVAVHAAKLGLPIAVIANSLELDRYAPLPLIKNKADWSSFVEALSEGSKFNQYQDLSRKFVENSIYSGDAAGRIVDDILCHL